MLRRYSYRIDERKINKLIKSLVKCEVIQLLSVHRQAHYFIDNSSYRWNGARWSNSALFVVLHIHILYQL
jgi:hypothetical protein